MYGGEGSGTCDNHSFGQTKNPGLLRKGGSINTRVMHNARGHLCHARRIDNDHCAAAALPRTDTLPVLVASPGPPQLFCWYAAHEKTYA